MAATETGEGEMAAMQADELGKYGHSYIIHPIFAAIFPKTLKQSKLERDGRKVWETCEVHRSTTKV